MNFIERIKDKLDGFLHDTAAKSRAHVETALDAAAAGNEEKLKWRQSVVDLLKLCNLPSDMVTRIGVAGDLGIVSYTGTEAQNIDLHKLLIDDLRRGGIDLPDAPGC